MSNHSNSYMPLLSYAAELSASLRLEAVYGWETLTPNLDKIILPRPQKILVFASKIYFYYDTKKWKT